MFTNSTSLIIPTKDRFNILIRMFISLGKYSGEFDEIIIVDSSSKYISSKINDYFKKFKNVKIFRSSPSTSLQRNIGIKNAKKDNKFLMFCDDDIIFERNSLIEMNKCIIKSPNEVGFGFNLKENMNKNFIEKLKKNYFFIKFGIYHNSPGVVCDNGWHTKNVNIKQNIKSMWLSTQACIFRKKNIENNFFDTSLGSYSYLEDLFFSYQIYKKGNFIICSNSKYSHPNTIDRLDFKFGVQEVINRYKFVKTFKLNKKKFYITIFIKSFANFFYILSGRINFIKKFFGNLIGIFLCLVKK